MSLGQTEIFTPAPTKRLIVPAGATAWWGVDPGSVRVAIGTIAADGRRGVSVRSFPKGLEGGERLAAIFEFTRSLALDLEAIRPGIIIVEQPSGKQSNPALSYAVGAIMAGLWTATGARVVTVSSSSWKKTACGAGNAYKPYDKRGKLGPIEDYAVYRWALSTGYSGCSYDEVDAWGIAEYAARTFALDAR